MKTIYSFNEFFDMAVSIAAKKGIDYVKAEIARGTRSDLVFRCYAHGFAYYEGATMEAALESMNRAICPEDFTKPNIDVEIELPIQVTE